jgi:predicted HTH transcriptional regulator
MGTGTGEIIKLCTESSLKMPEFIEEESFITTLWRNEEFDEQNTIQVKKHGISELKNNTHQVPYQYHTSTVPVPYQYRTGTVPVEAIVEVVVGEMERKEIQNKLNLLNKAHFLQVYLQPAIEQGLVAMKYPDKPNHPHQKYYLTEKGVIFLTLNKKKQRH